MYNSATAATEIIRGKKCLNLKQKENKFSGSELYSWSKIIFFLFVVNKCSYEN